MTWRWKRLTESTADRCFLCGASQTIPLWRWSQEHYLSRIGRPDVRVGFAMCGECGLARQHPPLPEEIVARLYTELNLEAGFTDFDERYIWLCRALGKEPEPGVLLDIGCSEGRQAQVYASRSWRAVGIETNPEAAQRAAAKGIEVMQCSVEEADLCGEAYDLILFFHLLEHLASPRDFLQKITGALRPGGYLYFEVPNLEKPWGNLINFFPSFHSFVFGPNHIERLLAELPVQIIRGEDAVNQRWLVRKAESPEVRTIRDPAPPGAIANACACQSLAISIGSQLAQLRSAANPADSHIVNLSQPMRAYIAQRIPPLAEWRRQWEKDLHAKPDDSLLRLIAMLYQNLDLYCLLKYAGMQVLGEPSLMHWGRAVRFLDFYREDIDQLLQGFNPSSLIHISEQIDSVTAILMNCTNDR